MEQPKFIQITTGSWKGPNGDLTHAVYGLSADGKVYKFFANEGWTLMRGRNEASSPARRPVPAPRPAADDDDIPF
jgi:hypothetical protein